MINKLTSLEIKIGTLSGAELVVGSNVRQINLKFLTQGCIISLKPGVKNLFVKQIIQLSCYRLLDVNRLPMN